MVVRLQGEWGDKRKRAAKHMRGMWRKMRHDWNNSGSTKEDIADSDKAELHTVKYVQ